MTKQKFKPEDVFTESKSVGPRNWGEELLLYNSPGSYSFKLLKLNAGSKGGLQYHRKKDEITYIVSGKMLVKYDLNDGKGLQEVEVGAGDWIRFPTGMVHQEIALTDVIRVEASTPHFNDRVRVETEYGLDEEEGLPTTAEHEIIFR